MPTLYPRSRPLTRYKVPGFLLDRFPGGFFEPLSFEETTKYVAQHCHNPRRVTSMLGGPCRGVRGQFASLARSLRAFKKVRLLTGEWGIVNLTIPPGAHIYVPNMGSGPIGVNDFKFRANKAFVHTIVELTPVLKRHTIGHSIYNRQFKYVEDSVVYPEKFSRSTDICRGGIHFFVNLVEAIDYR